MKVNADFFFTEEINQAMQDQCDEGVAFQCGRFSLHTVVYNKKMFF